MGTYEDFLATKRLVHVGSGKDVPPSAIHPTLYPFQRDTVLWALRKGRAAIWQDCGLGKSRQQVEWASHVGGTVLIIAPLTVAQQTIKEAAEIDRQVTFVRDASEITSPGIYISNFEMLRHFVDAPLDGMVIDEASILKSIDGKIKSLVLEQFTNIPYRLSCTATPCPNDIAELAPQAEFLGVMTRTEMLATFFVHDEDGWRLRGHARQAFYRWLASWAIAMRNPSDLGYDGSDFILPPLTIRDVTVDTEWRRPGELYPGELKGISDRADVRKLSVQDRVEAAAGLANGTDEQVVIFCGINPETDACLKAIPDAVGVNGSDSIEVKVERLQGFIEGRYRVLVTKPKVAGLGLNLQNAHRIIFVGLSDSYEAYYQCIRRCYRYRQQHPVTVDIVLTDHETQIIENVRRKELESTVLVQGIIDAGKEFSRMELREESVSGEVYETHDYKGESWEILQGDACERMRALEGNSVDLSIFSPPFLSLYSYSPTERDLGNSRNEAVFFEHFGYIIDELLRVTKHGRIACVHVSQVPAMLVRDGYIGLKDFRGKTIDAFEDRGWIFSGDITIWKNPQSQSIRTHSKALAFQQLHKDRSWLRPCLADYILVFRAPGENDVPIIGEVDNETWIEWASPVWWGINETRTLDVSEGRSDEDDKHICALQLDVIERCVRLWSNPGEMIFSPFAGIGSEGYEAIRLGRSFTGIELKPIYCRAAARNLQRAEQLSTAQLRLGLD